MKKGFTIGAIIFIFGVIAMAVAFSIGGNKVYDVTPSGEQKEYTFTDSYKEIHFDTRNRGLEVKQSPDDNIHLVVNENEDRYYKFTEDGNLNVQYVENVDFFNNNIFSLIDINNDKAELYIPNNLEQKLVVDAENGIIEISGVELNSIDLDNQNVIVNLDNVTTLNDITINNTNGLIDIKDIKTRDFVVDNENAMINVDTLDANNVKIHNQNAYVTISNVYSNNNIDISNSNASVDFKDIDFEKELTVNTDNAHVRGNLLGAENDYTFDVTTTNGNAKINGKTVNGVIGNGSKLVQVKSQNASVDINTN